MNCPVWPAGSTFRYKRKLFLKAVGLHAGMVYKSKDETRQPFVLLYEESLKWHEAV
jgi:hypothetical protein